MVRIPIEYVTPVRTNVADDLDIVLSAVNAMTVPVAPSSMSGLKATTFAKTGVVSPASEPVDSILNKD